MRSIIFIFVQFLCSIIEFGKTEDIVVNSVVTAPVWSSLMFTIPFDLPHQRFSEITFCKDYSMYFCLLAFVTENYGKALLSTMLRKRTDIRPDKRNHIKYMAQRKNKKLNI